MSRDSTRETCNDFATSKSIQVSLLTLFIINSNQSFYLQNALWRTISLKWRDFQREGNILPRIDSLNLNE